MSIEIGSMLPDDSVGGSELIPVSDAGTPKSVTPSKLSDFTIAEIESIPSGSSVSGSDGVFLLHGGNLVPVNIDLVLQRAIDTIWAKSLNASPASSDVVPVKAGGTTEKTMTLPVLAEYVRSLIEAAILDISDIGSVVGLNSSDTLLVCQGSTAKKATLSDITASIYSSFYAYANALSALDAGSEYVYLYAMAGGVSRKISLAVVKSWLGLSGCVIAPASSTENKIPQWDTTSKTLKDGLAVVTEVRASGSTDDASIPTEQAVREMQDAFISGLSDIDADIADDDNILLHDATAGVVRKSAFSRVFTYFCARFNALLAKTSPVGADYVLAADTESSNEAKRVTFSNMWTNIFLALAKAIKLDEFAAPDDNTNRNATTTTHGLLLKATAPTSGLLNVVGIANGETAYANKALFDATAPAALAAAAATGTALVASRRDHVHALPATDALAATTDITTNDATTSKHGLMPKADKIKLDAITYSQSAISAPASPADGKHIIWQSNGTGGGDAGDIMIKITSGGVTKTATLIDFSAV